ncbi:metalloregulator ArsR/SmtB family transcription factor [Massilia sp. NEAU-DD11]|uniref:Metalloregulator ArsR/SmtB family transcription factor n=1 Tax=Massilia cellulosiltytica TaxID=2683234 RepID=A0A7X3G6F7_9BURK|nr:metalloregulator ArsR/SmtB family transcription factor [Telluria cellulosilytica]MVW63582.1 metalloregulator ArsR/SmtB family transcription factor [Telluria cellulosilytica]
MDTVTTLPPDAMRVAAAQAGGLLKALANPDRLLLLCQLAQGEQPVGALEAALDIRQPTLSQQLAVLRQEGLIATRRDGKQIFYSVASPEALAVLQLLYQLYCPKED